MKKEINEILNKLPLEITAMLTQLTDDILDQLEEIRLRLGQPVLVFAGGREYRIQTGRSTGLEWDQMERAFASVLDHSVYAHQEELKDGFITLEGGHRVGICGRVVLDQGKIVTMKEISSLNIRRSREITGISDPLMKYLLRSKKQIYNTILVSPPQCGKTTLLRDLIRNCSNLGFKVAVCDERSELAGGRRGRLGFQLGSRTDVLDGCPKDQGIHLLLRTMSPDIIATDEVGKSSDLPAIEAATCAGVSLITTLHGSHFQDVQRSRVGALLTDQIFQRLVFLTNQPVVGQVACITDAQNQRIDA